MCLEGWLLAAVRDDDMFHEMMFFLERGLILVCQWDSLLFLFVFFVFIYFSLPLSFPSSF